MREIENLFFLVILGRRVHMQPTPVCTQHAAIVGPLGINSPKVAAGGRTTQVERAKVKHPSCGRLQTSTRPYVLHRRKRGWMSKVSEAWMMVPDRLWMFHVSTSRVMLRYTASGWSHGLLDCSSVFYAQRFETGQDGLTKGVDSNWCKPKWAISDFKSRTGYWSRQGYNRLGVSVVREGCKDEVVSPWVKNQNTKLLSISSPNVERFSKFFCSYTRQEIRNEEVIKDLATL